MNDDYEKCKRALGGMTASFNRAKKRCEELEALATEALNLLGTWDYVDWECAPDGMRGDSYIPEGNYMKLLFRANELGLKPRRRDMGDK